MSTRSGRIRPSAIEASPTRNRKGVSPPRSPGRPRKSSPPRTATRKSPSRKSPSRKPVSKFPARKSPSRTTKEPTESSLKSPSKRQALKSDISVKLQDVTKLDVYRGTRNRRSEYSIKDLPSVDSFEVNGVELLDTNDVYTLRNRKPVEDVALRRSGRLRSFGDNIADIRRSFSTSQSKSISKSVSQSIDIDLTTYSDEDDSDQSKAKSEAATRKLATPLRGSVNRIAAITGRWEFGGRIGSALLILLIPTTVFAILISCKTSCSILSLLDLSMYKSYKSVSAWLSWEPLAVVTAQYLIQGLLALVPIGEVSESEESGPKLRFNGLYASILTIILLFTLTHFKLFIGDNLLGDYLRLAVASYIVAVILSIALYVKSRKLGDKELNPYGSTGHSVYDFCLGREINPSFKRWNIKLWIARITNINALILCVLIFKQGILLPAKETAELSMDNYKEFLDKVQLKHTTLLYSMMQIIYILNFILKEHQITTTFYWQSEGLGYLQLVSSALYPFYFTTIAKFVADKEITLSTNALISASGIFLLGYITMLLSNNIKHVFRTNPLHPSLANIDSMPTFHGKKLLTSNVWRLVRHPNYTGDILIHIALALPALLNKQYAAAAPAILTILLLLHRAIRDNTRCRRRYGAAWERYCKRVPKVFVPKIL